MLGFGLEMEKRVQVRVRKMKNNMYSVSVQAGKGTQGKSINLCYAHTDCDLTFWKHSKSTEILLKGWS